MTAQFHNHEKERTDQQQRQAETSVHPFVLSMARMGANIGKEIGLLALRALEANKNGPASICVWHDEAKMPEVVKTMLPADVKATMVVIVPPDTLVPQYLLEVLSKDGAGSVLKRENVDGSWIMCRVAKAEADGQPKDA